MGLLSSNVFNSGLENSLLPLTLAWLAAVPTCFHLATGRMAVPIHVVTSPSCFSPSSSCSPVSSVVFKVASIQIMIYTYYYVTPKLKITKYFKVQGGSNMTGTNGDLFAHK